MGKDPYVSPKGFTHDVLEIFPYRVNGMACLVVQSNQDRDQHFSEINVCSDFENENPETVFSLKSWIYSMFQTIDEKIYIAHSGKKIRFGTHQEPQIVLNVDIDMTRLCPSSHGVYVLGLNGYVGHFDGRILSDMPVLQAGDIYYVSEAPDGSIFASGSKGGLYRRESNAWVKIELGIGSEIYRVLALNGKSVLLAGSEGLAGRYDSEELIPFSVPTKRDYRDIAVFKGKTYFGAGFQGLDVLEDLEVVPFKPNVITYKMFANEKFLFTAGYNLAARFDGNSWLATEFK